MYPPTVKPPDYPDKSLRAQDSHSTIDKLMEMDNAIVMRKAEQGRRTAFPTPNDATYLPFSS
jgi:hypothetical protein